MRRRSATGQPDDEGAPPAGVSAPPARTVGLVPAGDAGLGETLAALQASDAVRPRPGRLVARGGMGVVRAVEDPLLERLQAEKSLRDTFADDPAHQAALLREARLMGALEHPGIVPVHSVALNAEGRLGFSMKLVQGQSLSDLLRAMPVQQRYDRDRLLDLVDIVVKVCDALAHAHARGVVHCDVKSTNVMVAEHGQVYLMDWGVARVLADGAGALPASLRATSARSDETDLRVCGSPAHVAPEQARGEGWRIGPRTDVFLVGALLYEILTRCPVNDARISAKPTRISSSRCSVANAIPSAAFPWMKR